MVNKSTCSKLNWFLVALKIICTMFSCAWFSDGSYTVQWWQGLALFYSVLFSPLPFSPSTCQSSTFRVPSVFCSVSGSVICSVAFCSLVHDLCTSVFCPTHLHPSSNFKKQFAEMSKIFKNCKNTWNVQKCLLDVSDSFLNPIFFLSDSPKTVNFELPFLLPNNQGKLNWKRVIPVFKFSSFFILFLNN